METVKSAELYSLAQGEGPIVWAFGAQTFIKATGEQTGGALGLIEQFAAVGVGSPYHVHHGEDEIFFVLEGELTFFSGERRFTGGAGSYTFFATRCSAWFQSHWGQTGPLLSDGHTRRL